MTGALSIVGDLLSSAAPVGVALAQALERDPEAVRERARTHGRRVDAVQDRRDDRFATKQARRRRRDVGRWSGAYAKAVRRYADDRAPHRDAHWAEVALRALAELDALGVTPEELDVLEAAFDADVEELQGERDDEDLDEQLAEDDPPESAPGAEET